MKILQVQNNNNNNLNFGMPWTRLSNRSRLDDWAIKNVLSVAVRKSNYTPLDYFPSKVRTKMEQLPDKQRVIASALITSIDKNSPYHAVFYKEGIGQDYVYAVPINDWSKKISAKTPVFDRHYFRPLVESVNRDGVNICGALRKLSKRINYSNAQIDTFREMYPSTGKGTGNSDKIRLLT